MEQGHSEAVKPPLYYGRTFHCYRDVNKAIEKHREMFGLRLALKRAVKLENYCLTIDQMKDLNLRLKYGELDYHCFAATGRPGRPGNDERCPQLVRLKLSPDAQSLVVYETHNHNIIPHNNEVQTSIVPTMSPSIQQLVDLSLLPNHPFCLKGDITVTPIISDNRPKSSLTVIPNVPPLAKDNFSPAMSRFIINSNNSFTSLVPLTITPMSELRTQPITEKNSLTIIPTSSIAPVTHSSTINAGKTSENRDKITVKIKKSECAPNEMVVVGSVRHMQEQQKSKSFTETQVGHAAEVQKSVSFVAPTSSKSEVSSKPAVTISRPITTANLSTSSVSFSYSNSVSPTVINSTEQKKVTSNIITPSHLTKADVSCSNNGSVKAVNIVKVHSPVNAGIRSGTNLGQGEQVKCLPDKKTAAVRPHQTVDIRPAVPPKQGASVKPTVLKQSSNMKQVIINKPTPRGTVSNNKSVINKKLNNSTQSPGVKQSPPVISSVHIRPLAPKIVQSPRIILPALKPNSANITVSSTVSDTPSSKAAETPPLNKPSVKVIGKNEEKSVTKNNEKLMKQTNKLLVKNKEQQTDLAPPKQPVMPANGNTVPSRKVITVAKKLRKKPGRRPDSSCMNNRSTGLVDTELGYNEKQTLAHGVLLQLLRVTSQLPMVEFSHALETLEDLTDAFKLNQKVSLSIRHDEEDMGYGFLNMMDGLDEKDTGVSSTTDDYKLAQSQFDGQLDIMDLLKELTSFNEAAPGGMDAVPQFQVLEEKDDYMEVEINKEGSDITSAGTERSRLYSGQSCESKSVHVTPSSLPQSWVSVEQNSECHIRKPKKRCLDNSSIKASDIKRFKL